MAVVTRFFLLCAVLLMLPAITAAQTPEYYGAVAYDIENRVVVADKGASPENALAAAEQACQNQGGGDSCQALGWFTNSFASLALAPADRRLPNGHPEGRWGFAWGFLDITEADRAALEICNENSPGGCQLVLRVGIGGSTRDWGNAAPLDNYIVDGFIEGEIDHIDRDYWAVDFDTNDDDPAIYPTRAGRVVFAGCNCQVRGQPARTCDNPYPRVPCYGYSVVIDHGNGLSSFYTHMLEGSLPEVGQQVTPLTRIGTMSDSGCPSEEPYHSNCGTHLHYSMRRGSIANNPIYGPTEAVRTPWREGSHSGSLSTIFSLPDFSGGSSR